MDGDLLWKALGPWAASMGIAIWWITHLVKALARERARAEALTDAMLQLAERSLPALQDSTSSLRESASIIRQVSKQLAVNEVLTRDLEERLDRRP